MIPSNRFSGKWIFGKLEGASEASPSEDKAQAGEEAPHSLKAYEYIVANVPSMIFRNGTAAAIRADFGGSRFP